MNLQVPEANTAVITQMGESNMVACKILRASSELFFVIVYVFWYILLLRLKVR